MFFYPDVVGFFPSNVKLLVALVAGRDARRRWSSRDF